MNRSPVSLLPSILVMSTLLGCGATRGPDDAGLVVDAGVDAGLELPVDAGRRDAGSDAGAPVDAGPVDAGGEIDGGGDAGLPACAQDETRCGTVCVDLDLDVEHCGVCDLPCAQNEFCVGGACQVDCPSPRLLCDQRCSDPLTDESNCGACGTTCATDAGQQCVSGQCGLVCGVGLTDCGGSCFNLESDPTNCGACGNICPGGLICDVGTCKCPGSQTLCGGLCVDTRVDNAHCGGCKQDCPSGQQCKAGLCFPPCPPNRTRCGSNCTETTTDIMNCGGCGARCGVGQTCSNSACVDCNPLTTDCDRDGWREAEGDCCDSVGGCGTASPREVNPGALELLGNGIDDNCNGLIDAVDTADLESCDTALASNSFLAIDFAKALGICRQTQEVVLDRTQQTWGLISAQLLKADGSPLEDTVGHSLRQRFGQNIHALEGQRLVLLSSGTASDATQSNPGPNSGGGGTSMDHNGTEANISTCTLPYCIRDWFQTANPPLKAANALPVAPNCGSGTSGSPETPNNSVMLALRVRVPTNMRSFNVSANFASVEYPEWVCTQFNDQMVVLVDTPGGTPEIPNPVDKNLMTYRAEGQLWPIGINIASGTDLFRVCLPKALATGNCWDESVNETSCSLGPSQLNGTGYEPTATNCRNGGGTGWLRSTGNVRPGEIAELRFVIWDVGDTALDSIVAFDEFEWNRSVARPGTVTRK